MRALVKNAALAAAIVCAASSVYAQAVKPRPLDMDRVQALLRGYNDLMYSANSHDCGQRCDVLVEIYVVNVALDPNKPNEKEDICVARLPKELRFAAGVPKPHTITWILTPKIGGLLPGETVYFHPEHGVVMLKDDAKEIKRLTIYGPDFLGLNVHTMKDKYTAFYVPFILWVDAGKEVLVCATGDPKIVNY